MAKYMVRYELHASNRNEAIKRFVDGAAMQPPEGVTDVARYHSADGNQGWAIAETDDPVSLVDWLLHWTDIISYEVTPVITDEELGGLFQKHGLG